jgi:hypothetical protein
MIQLKGIPALVLYDRHLQVVRVSSLPLFKKTLPFTPRFTSVQKCTLREGLNQKGSDREFVLAVEDQPVRFCERKMRG